MTCWRADHDNYEVVHLYVDWLAHMQESQVYWYAIGSSFFSQQGRANLITQALFVSYLWAIKFKLTVKCSVYIELQIEQLNAQRGIYFEPRWGVKWDFRLSLRYQNNCRLGCDITWFGRWVSLFIRTCFLYLLSRRWGHLIPPKCWHWSMKLHSVTSQKIVMFFKLD
jgi:hypothetical protein